MFSGKTEQLISRLAKAARSRRAVIAFKPCVDVRHPESELVSHAGERHPATLVEQADEILGLADTYDFVAIDEAQFLDDSIAEAASELRRRQVKVVAAGLDLNFRREPFGATVALIDIADAVIRRTSICERCGAVATLTQRLISGVPAPLDDDTFRVGSHELYEARCVRCYEAEEALRPRFESEVRR